MDQYALGLVKESLSFFERGDLKTLSFYLLWFVKFNFQYCVTSGNQ